MGKIIRIMEHRTARAAKETFNGKDKAASFEQLRKNPQMTDVLLKMSRAQRGLPLEGSVRGESTQAEEAMRIAEAYREEPEADEVEG